CSSDLNSGMVVQYINEARELGLEVLPPDVNESGFKFTVVGEGRVRFGLGAIKNVGGSAIESIIAGRQAGEPYRTLVDLCERIDLRLCNKRVIEALIDSGACDSLGGHRAQLVAALDRWSDQKVRVAAVVTVVKRQISKKSGAEYARLVLEDFHGTAEALVFPEAWAKLNEVIRPDGALLLTGSHSARDRDEEQAPFIVETAQPLDDLRAKGAIGVALVWSRAAPPPPDAARAVAALCAAHPGPCPMLVEVGNGGSGGGDGGGAGGGGEPPTRLRSRSLRVEVGDDLLAALREVVGAEHVHLVRTP